MTLEILEFIKSCWSAGEGSSDALAPFIMPFVQREASTSSTRFEVGSAPRSGHGKQRAEQMSKGQKVKSNHLRRQRADAELEELQARVDQIVSPSNLIQWTVAER